MCVQMIGQFTDLDNFGTALLDQREYGFLTLQSSCNTSLQVLLEVRAHPLPYSLFRTRACTAGEQQCPGKDTAAAVHVLLHAQVLCVQLQQARAPCSSHGGLQDAAGCCTSTA